MYIDYINLDWDKVEPGSYVAGIPALRFLRRLQFRKPVTFFVGENGSGKSTLLEAIAIAYGFNPEGGSLNYSFSTFDDHSALHRTLTVGRGRAGSGMDSFSGRRVFTTWLPRPWSTSGWVTGPCSVKRRSMTNPTAKVS